MAATLHKFNRICIYGGIMVCLCVLAWKWNISHDMRIVLLGVSYEVFL